MTPKTQSPFRAEALRNLELTTFAARATVDDPAPLARRVSLALAAALVGAVAYGLLVTVPVVPDGHGAASAPPAALPLWRVVAAKVWPSTPGPGERARGSR